MKKRKITALSIVCTMAMSVLPLFEGTAASAAFEKNATETVEEIVFGWNLGNSFDSYSGTTFGAGSLSTETSWGNPYTTKEMIDMVKDTGINAIRVPVTWYNHMDPNTYEIDDAWMNRVKEVIDFVIEDDMYCILNVHHDTGENGWLKASSNNLEQKEEIFTAIWEQVSVEFADYGDKLLFEGFNEILNDSSEWVRPDAEAVQITNELNQIFVDTVRSSGGNNDKRNLIVNTYCAGGNAEVTNGFVLPKDTVQDRLIVEAHVYQPFYFTSEHYPDVTTWGKSEMDSYLGNMYKTFKQNGIPVIIGEFGCVDKNNAAERLSWAQYYVETCTNYGFKCFWWDNGNEYKIFNRRTLKITEPELLDTMLAAAKGEVYVPDTSVKGDVNADGTFSVADIVLLQRWLLAVPNTTLANWEAGDFYKDGQLDVFDLCLMKRAILERENLCASEDNWNSWVDTEAGAEGEMDYVDGGITMQVNKGGEYEWNAQFFYEGLTLEQGASYKISFDYQADSAQSTSFHVMQGHDDYLPYYSGNLDWTTDVQHYEDTFSYTKATDKQVRIGFNLGGDGMDVPFNVTVTNLKLIKLSSGEGNTTPDTPQTPDTTEGENLTADVANFTSWINEEGGAAAEVTYLDNGIQIAVSKSGEEEWYIQGSYPDITLEEGAEYRISFDYVADKDVSLYFHIQQDYDPYGQYLYELLDYTNQTQHYSETFTMTEKTDKRVICVFNCGGADADAPFTVTITNLELVKLS